MRAALPGAEEEDQKETGVTRRMLNTDEVEEGSVTGMLAADGR